MGEKQTDKPLHGAFFKLVFDFSFARLRFFGRLRRGNFLICSAALQQLLVGSYIFYFTVIHNYDLVGVHNRGYSLSYHYHRSVRGDLL